MITSQTLQRQELGDNSYKTSSIFLTERDTYRKTRNGGGNGRIWEKKTIQEAVDSGMSNTRNVLLLRQI